MITLILAICMALVYAILQLQYILYWRKIPQPSLPPESTQAVSIVIVARNEAAKIVACLQGIISQQYNMGQFEIIVIDDHSIDGIGRAMANVQDDRIQLVRLKEHPDFIHPPAYKKSGITLGVHLAKHETIVVTDADCVHPDTWLSTMVNAFHASGGVFQTGPVLYEPCNTPIEKMQQMELLALMLITGSGIQSGFHLLANGANMVFTKTAFNSVQGYKGNEMYASGDDMFLAEKMHRTFPGKIHFIKSIDAAVLTEPAHTWIALLKQRLRWAGKNKGLAQKHISVIWLFVGLYHFALVLSLIFAGWLPSGLVIFLLLLTVKWVMDFFLVQESTKFFRKRELLSSFVKMQLLYTGYVMLLAGYWVMRRKSDWER